MSEFSNELIAKLKNAKSLEEVTELLRANGEDEANAEKLWKELETLHMQEDQELSLEELESVAGGRDINWFKEGCSATVEPGSDCWGSDGGCTFCHHIYMEMPNYGPCPLCGAKYVYRGGNEKTGYFINCHACKARYYYI